MPEARRPRPSIRQGATAAIAAKNLRRIRNGRGFSVYGLSDALTELGHRIDPSALAKIERGERQVSIDDLMALAVALDVSPSAILLPLTDDPAFKVEITGVGTVPANEAWDWMDGRRRLDRPCADPSAAALEYALYSRPSIRRNRQIGWER